MKIGKVFLAVLTLGITAISCEKDKEEETVKGDYQNGILVSNEGPFGSGTGTVSFISDDLETKESEIFNKVNSDDLGNIVQSIGFTDDKAFVVANVTNKISVVDRFTFESIATITEGLNNPRYFVAANGKGYVTNWGDASDNTDDFIAIIDLESYTVESVVSVEFGPERIVANESAVFVAHKGGFSYNNKISVIALENNSISKVIEVADIPQSLQFDAEGDLWVLSSGKPSWSDEETGGAFTEINTITNEVEKTIAFPSVADHPKDLSIEGSSVYYAYNSGVYAFNTADTTLPTAPVISDASFYSMTVFGGKVYGTDAKDFSSNGDLHIYDIENDYSKQTFTVGVIPGGVYAN